MKTMYHTVPCLLIFLLFVASTSLADPRLPANLQVDIVFPRENETYAPTQWFPVVVAVQNADAVWPQMLRINIWIRGMQWDVGRALGDSLGPDTYDVGEIAAITPNQTLFYYMATNSTNATTDTFNVAWDWGFPETCQANMSSPVSMFNDDVVSWYTHEKDDPYRMNSFQFHTAPGGKVPDMEETVSLCADLNQTIINGALITENKIVRRSWGGDIPCPVIEEGTISTTCQYKSKAKEVANEVEALMLKKMKCKEGTWQIIQAPCPETDDASSRGSLSSASWIGVMAVLCALNLV